MSIYMVPKAGTGNFLACAQPSANNGLAPRFSFIPIIPNIHVIDFLSININWVVMEKDHLSRKLGRFTPCRCGRIDLACPKERDPGT